MTEENPAPEGGGDEGFKPITSQEELNKVIGQRIAKVESKYANYSELEEKAAEFDKATDAQKSETQKALDRAEAAEKRALEFESRATRAGIQAKYKLSDDDAELFLTASDPEALERQAKTLSERLAATTTTNKRSATPFGKPAGDQPGSRSVQAIRELRGTA